jgi:hypothetical protein
MMVAILLVGLAAGAAEAGDSDSCALSLRVEPPRVVVPAGGVPRLSAYLTNTGTVPLTLVMPGDGSVSGWRTPTIEWILEGNGQVPGLPRCGNINPLQRGEVFTLAPGETRTLGPWIHLPGLRAPGTTRAVMHYSNVPNIEWRGIPLGSHDRREMDRVHRSDRCHVASSPIEIVAEATSPLPQSSP